LPEDAAGQPSTECGGVEEELDSDAGGLKAVGGGLGPANSGLEPANFEEQPTDASIEETEGPKTEETNV